MAIVLIILVILIVYWLIRPEPIRAKQHHPNPQIPTHLPPGNTVTLQRHTGELQQMEMFYRVAGNPNHPPVLLLHGIYGDSGSTWYNLYPKLSESYYVIGLDLRGHGRTTQPYGDITIPIMAEDVIAFMDSQNISKANIIGHSMGGLVAMYLTYTFPERVDKLILADTSATWRYNDLFYILLLYPYLVRIKNRLIGWQQESKDRARGFCRYEVEQQFHQWIYYNRSMNQMESFIASFRAIVHFDAKPFLHHITHPTMIIYGEDDDLVPKLFRDQLATHIHHATVCTISSPARHYPQLKYVDEFYDYVRGFLGSHQMTS